MWLIYVVVGLMRSALSRPWSRGSGPATRISETRRFAPGWCRRVFVVCRVSAGLEIGGVEHNYVAFSLSWVGVSGEKKSELCVFMNYTADDVPTSTASLLCGPLSPRPGLSIRRPARRRSVLFLGIGMTSHV